MAFLVGLLLACRPAEPPPGDPTRPDILLISIDSLRRDHVGAFGHSRATTPHIDALADAGLRFPRARSASPWTLPSHMTMLTGAWPTDHQVVEDVLGLSPRVPMIQERLGAVGWATAGFTSTIYVSKLFGFSRGFDVWDDGDVTEMTNLRHSVRMDDRVDHALRWVRSLPAGKPAFLFLHTYDVHYPYAPPAPWDTHFDPARSAADLAYRKYTWYLKHPLKPERLELLTNQYDECIAWVDSEIGRLVAAWKRPAYVIVLADHGEELMEHGSWGHAHTLHPEVLDIPLVVAGPGIGAAVRNERVATVDVANTVAAMAGIESLGGDGRDLRGPIPERRFWEETSRFDTRRLSVSEADYRLDLDLALRSSRLFAVGADPDEQQDVAGTHPEVVDQLSRAIFGRLPEMWELTAGTLTTTGTLYAGGSTLPTVVPPARFGVWPPSAVVSVDGTTPTRVVDQPPVAGRLDFHGTRPAVDVTLGAEVRAQLEALGYVQAQDE